MPNYAIDFKELKEQASFEPVLQQYRIEFKESGDQLSLRCPFHNDTEPSLKISRSKKVWQCFGCKAKGNVLDFVQRMEGNRTTLIQAAAKLDAICGLGLGLAQGQTRIRPGEAAEGGGGVPDGAKPPPAPAKPPQAAPMGPVNPPLSFALKLDPNHPYLDARGVTAAERDVFGLGHCDRGLMKGRVCIPIHDEHGQLVAYAGRWPGEAGWPAETGKYLLPPKFAKRRVLFNLHRVAGQRHLVVVEGFFSVVRLHALGIGAVALMGSALSAEHIRLLKAAGVALVTLLLDGGVAGRDATATMLPLLARELFVRAVELDDGEQPDTIKPEALAERVRFP